MAETIRKETQPKRRETEEIAEDIGATATNGVTEKGEELKSEIDDILDEIDEVLENNAEEFVRNYVQKGGQ